MQIIHTYSSCAWRESNSFTEGVWCYCVQGAGKERVKVDWENKASAADELLHAEKVNI